MTISNVSYLQILGHPKVKLYHHHEQYVCRAVQLGMMTMTECFGSLDSFIDDYELQRPKTVYYLTIMKICGPLRFTRKFYSKSRLCIALIIFAVLSFSYSVLPKLLFKLPPTYIGWRDDDFHQIREKGKGEILDKEIIILRWTAYFREYGTVKILNSEKCAMLEAGTTEQKTSSVFNVPCRISFDRRYLEESNALVFHSFDLVSEELPQEPRNLNQLWVYLQQESPIYTKENLQAYPNIFNWTMTYRRDSDVYYPYGHFAPIRDSQTRNLTSGSNSLENRASNLVKKKTRLVSWIVSSCDSDSKREYLVNELQKYVEIDIFGWCGQDCPSNNGNCYSHVERSHKFYLSFENSLCTDYITEKFFNALEANMVPVVYGGSESQDYLAIAPNYSYIDSRNFKSPTDLANYLTYLDHNDEEYLKYFEWRSKYKVVSTEMGWCNLCQRVYEHLQLVPSSTASKWYGDLWRWWNYMSYDTSLENDEVSDSSQMARVGQSYYYKLGAAACVPPLKKLINEGAKSKPKFEPGVFNGRIFGKLFGWAKDMFFS